MRVKTRFPFSTFSNWCPWPEYERSEKWGAKGGRAGSRGGERERARGRKSQRIYLKSKHWKYYVQVFN